MVWITAVVWVWSPAPELLHAAGAVERKKERKSEQSKAAAYQVPNFNQPSSFGDLRGAGCGQAGVEGRALGQEPILSSLICEWLQSL